MKTCPVKTYTTAYLQLLTVLIILILCLDTGSLPVLNRIAAAAPITSRDQHSRDCLKGKRIAADREVELVSTTSVGVTIQLVIPESDFHLNNTTSTTEVGKVENRTFSFPGCRFTTEPGTPRLPVQTTLIAVPADVDFQLRIVEKRFKTQKNIERMAYTPTPQGATQREKDRFFPNNIAEIREAGWIRENRILPIQLNPVQYNPVRREVRLYHQIVVEVRFIEAVTRAPSATRSGLRAESAVYNTILNNLLVNPQNIEQWRSPILQAPSAPSVPSMSPRYKISVTESGDV